MRHFLAIAFALLSLNLSAQITLDSADIFSVGDTFTVAIGKNPAVIDVKGGANHTWDFSSLSVDRLSGVKVRGVDANTYPQDTLFPNAGMRISSESYGESYLTKTADSVVLDGIAQLELVPGVGFDYNFDPDIKILDFPVNYNDMHTSITAIDTTIDTVILAFDSVKILIDFSQDVAVEGWGKLRTAQGSYDVLKVYSKEVQAYNVYGHIASVGWSTTPFITDADTFHNYRWFGKGEGYQMAEARTDTKDGATISASFLLTDSLFAFISDSSNPSCYGLTDGNATVKAIGGSGTYTYRWSAGSNQTSTISNVGEGMYSVTVTDVGTSDTAVTQVQITNPDSLSIYLISSKPEGPAPGTGEIEIGVLGGTMPYSYAWDNSSSTDKIASDLTAGTHTVTVTDANNCTKDTSITIGSIVSVENYQDLERVSLYPNPVSFALFINGDLAEQFEFRVLNLVGTVVMESSTQSTDESIDVSALEKGVYFAQIQSGQDIYTLQFIKQ